MVERVFNKTFSQALIGQTWQTVESISDNWFDYDQKLFTWKQIEEQTCKGQSSERLDYSKLSWSQMESQTLSWRQIELRDTNHEIFRGIGVDHSKK